MVLARAGSCSGQCHQISSQLPCYFTHSLNLGMMPSYSGLVLKLFHAPRRIHIFQNLALG